MYDHKYVIFFNFSVWSTVSSFLHIMITHKVDFCKTKPRFFFSFESYSSVNDENGYKTIFILFVKN